MSFSNNCDLTRMVQQIGIPNPMIDQIKMIETFNFKPDVQT